MQLNFTLQVSFSRVSLNRVVVSTDSSDLSEAVIHHCLRITSAGLTKVRDGKSVCFYVPFPASLSSLCLDCASLGLLPFHSVRCECCALHPNG